MKNYKDMTTEEIKEQLEWSDQHEFSYGYSMWAFKEIERLNNIINELERYLEKTIIDGGTRGSMTFWYRQIYDYLQELKGESNE